MKLNERLAGTLSIISVLNVIILTALMHLKFHVTNANLLRDSISVATYSFVKNVKDSIESGIPLDSISYIPEKIDYIKRNNSIIENIFVFSVVDNRLIEVFPSNTNLPASVRRELIKSINSGKSSSWRYEGEGDDGFVGDTIRDNVGNDRAAVIVTYSKKNVYDKEDAEILNLYRRMVVAVILCVCVSFAVGFHYTAPIARLIGILKKVASDLRSGERGDTSKILDLNVKERLDIVIDDALEVDKRLSFLEKELRGGEHG